MTLTQYRLRAAPDANEILAIWQQARDAKSTTGLALALSLADENARASRATNATKKEPAK